MDEREQIDYKRAYEEAKSQIQFWEQYNEKEKEYREAEKVKADNRLTVIVVFSLVAVSCFSVGFEYPVDDMNIFSILFNVVINGVGAFLIGGLIYGIGLGIDELIQSKVIKVIAIVIVGFIALSLGAWMAR